MPMMESQQLLSFIWSIAGQSYNVVDEAVGITKPVGEWPEHWMDPVHEPVADATSSVPDRNMAYIFFSLSSMHYNGNMALQLLKMT